MDNGKASKTFGVFILRMLRCESEEKCKGESKDEEETANYAAEVPEEGAELRSEIIWWAIKDEIGNI